MAGGACLQNSLSIDTTALPFSGCYQLSAYAGLYETLVWTIEGRDIAPTGTKAISASHIDGDEGDPFWTIGTVISNPQNTWSDGFSAGLEVVDVVCTGTSPFWETEGPSEEIQWACDSNADGVRSVAENGDFQAVVCGCPDAAGNIPTPTPTAGVQVPTQAPATTVVVEPTTAPSSAVVLNPTLSPPGEPALTPDATQTTPAPIVGGGGLAPVATACNITLSSPDLQDVSGCYIGRGTSNSRAKWVKIDESASIEWQESGDAGRWVVRIIGYGAPDEIKCIASKNVEDPTVIPKLSWTCDLDGSGGYTPALSFDFDGLECSGTCDLSASAGALDADSSDGSTGRTIAIAVGSVVSGIGLAALIMMGAVLWRRRRRTRSAGAKPVASAKDDAPADPNTAPVVPVFEPWGTRPAPRYYG
eukprot:g14339.t1